MDPSGDTRKPHRRLLVSFRSVTIYTQSWGHSVSSVLFWTGWPSHPNPSPFPVPVLFSATTSFGSPRMHRPLGSVGPTRLVSAVEGPSPQQERVAIHSRADPSRTISDKRTYHQNIRVLLQRGVARPIDGARKRREAHLRLSPPFPSPSHCAGAGFFFLSAGSRRMQTACVCVLV